MKKNSILAAAVLALTLATAAMAEDQTVAAATGGCSACPADPAVTGDVYIGLVSKYLFRGNNLTSDNAFNIQGGIDLTYKAFTLSYWTTAQNRNTGYSRAKVTENDLILDYAIPYKLPFADKLAFNVGTQYFAVDTLDDTNEFYFKASYETLLAPTVAVYWDNMAASRAGLFYTAAISHTFEIERNLLGLNLGALVSYNQRNPSAAYFAEVDPGDGVYNGWHNYELTASVDYTPTSHVTITPSYMFSNHLSGKAHDLAGITAQSVYGLKATFSF
jgi:hypothetical protein